MPFWCPQPHRIRNPLKRWYFRTPAPAPTLAIAEAGAGEDECQMPPNQNRPWSNIPAEILCYICDQAFSETGAHYGVEVLALVCKLWYLIVTGYGRPWSIIRIEPDLCCSTVYSTPKSYVNTRLKHSHQYPLDVTIRPVPSDWSENPTPLEQDIKDAIHAVVGGGLHARRWRTLNAIVHPFVRARLTYPTPILRRVVLEGINQSGFHLGGLFPVAPKLHVLSLTGENSDYRPHLPASTAVTLDSLQLEGFGTFACIAILEKFVKSQQLTALELTGTWSNAPGIAPIALPAVRTLILNARGPISVMFSAIILPDLAQLVVIGGRREVERQNVVDDRDAFALVASKVETLRLESLHFDNKDHLKSTLVAAPKVGCLTMKDITYRAPVEPALGVNKWRRGRKNSSTPDYVTLLKEPQIFPVLRHCVVDDIDREDLVLLRRPRAMG